MDSRSLIHQDQSKTSRQRSSSSQGYNIFHGWNPDTESERKPSHHDGPSQNALTRSLSKRGQQPPIPPSSVGGATSRRRSPFLVEKVYAARMRRSLASPSAAMESQGSRERGSSLGGSGAACGQESSHDNMGREMTRKRDPSLVAKAKELLSPTRADTKAESSFRRPPGQSSRYDDSAIGDEKARLSIEAETPCFNLIQRWKDPNDWLEPSDYWKRTHPAMNFRLWKIIVRNPRMGRELKISAQRNLEEAVRLYEQKGGNARERWNRDVAEEMLDSWSLSFGGHDPPRCSWTLEE